MKNWRVWFILALVVIAGGAAYFTMTSPKDAQGYQGTELSGTAPDFQLTDQDGSVINLSDFRGKVVVLTFMDSQCQDTCPLTAVHFRRVYQQLNQSEANRVVFLGVNVNVQANAIADVLETTRAWHMDEIPSWHFLTGEAGVLEPVWKDYGVAALPNPDGSITHTPGTFLIDSSVQKRWYISTPFSEDTSAGFSVPLNQLLVNHIREILKVE